LHAHHEWVATNILPHETEARAWLRRNVHRLTTSDIDDLMQDAYTRLWSVDYTQILNGRSYLFTVIRHLLMEQARRARIVPMERLGEIDAMRIPSEEPGPDRRAGAQKELERLEQIVAGLPEQCRRAFQLQKFQSLSQREIAHEMNITEKTVEKHLATALTRVLDAFRDDEREVRQRDAGARGYDARHSKD
jgi:RNA polymerase sigma-70 factor (ECF subfamily)